MIVDVKTKAVCQIDIDEYEAFRLLCKTLGMDYICDERMAKLFVGRDGPESYYVYRIVDGHDEVVDERGKLFIALANVAVNIFPNVEFRNADFIYKED